MSFSFPYKQGKRLEVHHPPHHVILDAMVFSRFLKCLSSEKSGIILPSWPCVWLVRVWHMYFNSMPHGKITSSFECVQAIFLRGYHFSDFLITAITYSLREMSSAFKGIYRGPWLCSASFQVRGLLDNVNSNQRRSRGCQGRTEEPLRVSGFSVHRQGEDGR